jgi:hypothetical protein
MIELSTDETELLRLVFNDESIWDYDILRFRMQDAQRMAKYEKMKHCGTYREFLNAGGTFEKLLILFMHRSLFVDIEDLDKDYDELQERGIITLLQSIMVDNQ